MRYLCLGYHDEALWRAMNAAERESLVAETTAYQEMLRKNGHFKQGLALESVANSTVLHFEAARVGVTDGPFAETKEQLGGVMVLEAVDLNHAIQLVSAMPCMRVGGSLEIRPINEELSS